MGVPGVYVHVPFCARRCGYCDFNTYVLGRVGLSPGEWLSATRAEIALAARELDARPLRTVFFGGGTPTLIGAHRLVAVLDELRAVFGLADDAEVTVEANPETVTEPLLDELLAGGVTRLSLGFQSADEPVLATLDRAHTPGQALECVDLAHRAGFRDVSLDLIYGTPGETPASWRATLDAALSVRPEHISCYALIVEPGTPLARRIAAGDLPAPDDDLMADEYAMADETLAAAGMPWYELSNWASPGHECRHNLAYWQGADWWGVGPGAHSHVGDRRWWNHKSPRRWASALAQGQSPAAGGETIDDATAHEERILLELRLNTGLPIEVLTRDEASRITALVDDGLVTDNDAHIVLTRRGRLLADLVTRQLMG